jgi:hypothetical protein
MIYNPDLPVLTNHNLSSKNQIMRYLLVFLSLIFSVNLLHHRLMAQTIPFSVGRIVISSDGNEHDHDDWAATPFSLALLAAKGLQNNLVLYTYSDHVWGSNINHPNASEQMRISALEGGEQFGFTNTKFMEAVSDSSAAVNAIVKEINKSSKANPLTIIAAGPMHLVGSAIAAAKPSKLKFVRLISHSKWNDNHSDKPDKFEVHSGWTWEEIEDQFAAKGLICDHIADQNGGEDYLGMRGSMEKFDWIKDSPARNNPAYKSGSWDWLYSRQLTCIKKGEFDPSDAGMVIYLLTGIEKTNPDDARIIMENSANDMQLPYYPKYKEVIVKFLDTYSISDIQYPDQFFLVKKPDGWHAMIVNILEEKDLKDEIFWSRNDKKYFDVNFPKNDAEFQIDEYKNIIDDWQNNYFTAISPFWAYVGWDKDVIDEYGDKTNLSDTLLNALARAYCSYSSNLLNNNTGFSSENIRFNLPKGQNSMTSGQLETYRNYHHKGIETYKRLVIKNPEFETFVANAYNVYSNEILNAYLTLLYHQNREEAIKELSDSLYDSFFIDMGKKYLASCDSNAILFTYGDSDTYPLLYLQENEGFREDVSVINIGLLASGRYISHLFDFGLNPVAFSISKESYENELNGYVYLTNKLASVNIAKAMEFVESNNPSTKLKINEDYYDFIPSKKLTLEVNKENIINNQDLYGTDISNSDSIITIELMNNYIFLNHLCLLDILSTNNFKRPVYFAITVSKENFFNLEDYFQSEGMAYKLTPYKRTDRLVERSTGFIDSGVQYRKLMNDLNFGPVEKNSFYGEVHKRMIANYRSTYALLIEKLILENKKDSAVKVLNYCLNEFSSEKVDYDYFTLSLIESSFKLGLDQKAIMLVENLYFTTLRNLESIEKEDDEYRFNLIIISTLKDIANQYMKNADLSQQINEKYNTLMNNTLMISD